MLRITEQEGNASTIRLRLDGSITDACFGELDSAISSHGPVIGKTIIIDMAGVDFMSGDSARRLAQLRSDRLHIINCSPFILTLLQSVSDKDSHDEAGV